MTFEKFQLLYEGQGYNGGFKSIRKMSVHHVSTELTNLSQPDLVCVGVPLPAQY